MDKDKVVPINKNKTDVSFDEFMAKQISTFPQFERDLLQLSLGLGDSSKRTNTNDEIAAILNVSKEEIDKNLAIGMKKLRDICQKEKSRQEDQDAYNEVRLHMHNKLIKKLRSVKEDWKLDNISQVTERIILDFFKDDIS